MAKYVSFGKRENEKKKQARRVEKQNRKEERKSSGKATSFEDMIAYVDENGMITSVPPEFRQKEEINQEDILISTPKREDVAPVILRGRVDYFNEAKGFGFIRDLSGTEKYFFHVNNVVDDISVNDIVTFDLERGDRGLSAVIILTFVAETIKKNIICLSQK